MEIGEDPEHISFLQCLSLCGNSHMLENHPDGVSSSIDIKYDEINPTCRNKPKSEIIRHDSRKRRKKTKDGLSRRNLIFCGSDGRTYASDYFNYSSHMKVSEMGTVAEIGGEVIVKLDQEVDSVNDSERRNSSFEEERENLLGKDVPVQERMEKDGFLEAEAREKAVEKDAVLERGEEAGVTESLTKTDNRIEIKKQKIGESARKKTNKSEEMETDSQQASPLPVPVNPHLQGFMLLMKMLCPIEKTIYPGFNSNEVIIGPMGDSSTSINMKSKPNQEEKRDTSSSSSRGSFNLDWIEEKREELPGEEMKSRHKENKRSHTEMEGLAAFPELSDSDGEPKMDEIPVRVLCRPPSEYRDKLIKVLKRPFDKSEYKELMNEATLKERKIVYKDLRFGRMRAVVTDEKSKSFFDLYPEVKRQVGRARRGRRLTLLRGFSFWLKFTYKVNCYRILASRYCTGQIRFHHIFTGIGRHLHRNCCHDGSFKPWQKGYKGSTVHLTVNDSKELQKNK